MPSEKVRDAQGRFVGSQGLPAWRRFVREHVVVERWLRNKAEGTRQLFAPCVFDFCRQEGLTPEGFVKLGRGEARARVWDFVSRWERDIPSRALRYQKALASFYRAGTGGEALTFDSGRGGAHHIRKRKVKNNEHIPSKEEVFRIVNAGDPRERAIILTLFQSGIRVNALCSLNLGHVRHCLENGDSVPCMLKVTQDLDSKLRGYSLTHYFTGLNKAALDALRAYCRRYHRDWNDGDAPLFKSRNDKRMSTQLVWHAVKKTIARAGMDRSSMWVHSFRKAFKKQVNKADISDDFREAIMGHVLPGSRGNYFDRYDEKDLKEAYMKIPLEPVEKSEALQMYEDKLEMQGKALKMLEQENQALKARLNGFAITPDQMTDLLKRIERLEKKAKTPRS